MKVRHLAVWLSLLAIAAAQNCPSISITTPTQQNPPYTYPAPGSIVVQFSGSPCGDSVTCSLTNSRTFSAPWSQYSSSVSLDISALASGAYTVSTCQFVQRGVLIGQATTFNIPFQIPTSSSAPCQSPTVTSSVQPTYANINAYPILSGNYDNADGCTNVKIMAVSAPSGAPLYGYIRPDTSAGTFEAAGAAFPPTPGAPVQLVQTVPNGAYTFQISNAHYDGSKPASVSVSFTINNPQCFGVSISSGPASGSTQPTAIISIRGSTSNGGGLNCNYLSLTVTKGAQQVYTSSTTSSSFQFNNIDLSSFGDGSYTYTVTNADPYGGRTNAISVPFSIATSSCPSLTGTSPALSTSQTVPFTFALTPTAGCNSIYLVITNAGGTVVSQTTTAVSGSTATIFKSLADGYYTYTAAFVQAVSGVNYRSSTTTTQSLIQHWLTPCNAPSIQTPASLDTRLTNTFTVSGMVAVDYPDCSLISIFVDGRTAAIATTNSMRKRSRSIRRASQNWGTSVTIANGRRTLTARSGQGNTMSGTSNAPEVLVLGTIQTGGLTPRKRRICAPGQDQCAYKASSGRLVQECVDDLTTNIERCGSCDGDDCTAIPNVDEVACIQGSCAVSSCVEGFHLLDNKCV